MKGLNVSELFDLSRWRSIEIENTKIPQKYQKLHQILRVNSHQQKRSFESERNVLIETLRHVPLGQLTKDQLTFLYKLSIADAIGQESIDTIEDGLYKNVIDVATSTDEIWEISQKLTAGIDKSNQIEEALTECVVEEKYELDNEILMRVGFNWPCYNGKHKGFQELG